MNVLRPRTWAGFHRAVASVRREYAVTRRELGNGEVYERKNRILFRGQASARWPLTTTLERKTTNTFDVLNYVATAGRAVSEIETFTGRTWSMPERPTLVEEIKSRQDPARVHLPAYDFLVYLRHHGYPSPLLDWTESPYIAAYFALVEETLVNPAIYCYTERPKGSKGGTVGAPMITVKGPYVSSHRRHFAQKAWYTICTKWNRQSEQHEFCAHGSVFERQDEGQDVIVKIVLPHKARAEALGDLNDFNINHFTLFQSEESLVTALGQKHFDLDEV